MIPIPRWRQSLSLLLLCTIIVTSACDSPRTAPAPAPVVRNDAAEPSEPVPEARSRSVRAVVAEKLPYGEIDEELVYGYFAFPADMSEPLPAVILIHDRWGVDDAARQLSERLAAEGYIVVAIDLFGGETADAPASARLLEIEVFENPNSASDNIMQAYRFIRDTFGAEQIASVGFGFGGGWSLNAALLLPNELDASVIYYGQVINDPEKLQPLQVPVLGLFAENDRVITAHSVLSFEAALTALDKEFNVEIFSGAGRGFSDARSSAYDPNTADLAWTMTIEFLRQHMVTESD